MGARINRIVDIKNQQAKRNIWEKLLPFAPSCWTETQSCLKGALFGATSSKFIVLLGLLCLGRPVSSGGGNSKGTMSDH